MKTRKRSKTPGFSLIEIMIALAIAATLSLGLAHVMDMSNKATKGQRQAEAFKGLVAKLTFLFENPEACQMNFEGVSFVPSSGPELLLYPAIYAPDLALNEGPFIVERGVRVGQLNISRLALHSTGKTDAIHYLLRLELTAEKPKNASGTPDSFGSGVFTHEFTLKAVAVREDNDKRVRISSCVLSTVPEARKPANETRNPSSLSIVEKMNMRIERLNDWGKEYIEALLDHLAELDKLRMKEAFQLSDELLQAQAEIKRIESQLIVLRNSKDVTIEQIEALEHRRNLLLSQEEHMPARIKKTEEAAVAISQVFTASQPEVTQMIHAVQSSVKERITRLTETVKRDDVAPEKKVETTRNDQRVEASRKQRLERLSAVRGSREATLTEAKKELDELLSRTMYFLKDFSTPKFTLFQSRERMLSSMVERENEAKARIEKIYRHKIAVREAGKNGASAKEIANMEYSHQLALKAGEVRMTELSREIERNEVAFKEEMIARKSFRGQKLAMLSSELLNTFQKEDARVLFAAQSMELVRIEHSEDLGLLDPAGREAAARITAPK